MSSIHIPSLKQPVTEKDHIQGPPDFAVTLLEYGDYQCPYCGEAYPIVKRVQEKFATSLRFVFRNFPLTNVHPYAEIGAEIAESSSAQGKFWEMHDFLYEHQSSLANPEFFLNYAQENLGLDSDRMRKEISSHAHLPEIKEDFMTGVRSGVNGTPTFFINGLRHNGDYQFETLVAAIENALMPPKPSRSSPNKKKAPTKKSKAPAKKVRAR